MLHIRSLDPPFEQFEAAQEAQAHLEAAKAQPLNDGGLKTARLLDEALRFDPHNHEAQLFRERLHQMFVPRWHFPMMADTARNRAYAEAITAKVRPGDIVLDIGCGAGLTAMMAARAGAKHVYACEQQPLIAEAARKVIAANGLSDKITVIGKWSHQIIIGEDMPEPADVVVSEIVDTVLLGEGALATLTHAMSALAKPAARAVPECGQLSAVLVESDKLMDRLRPVEAEGFDLSAFHRFSRMAQMTPSDFASCGLREMGPAAELFDFDFTRPDMKAGRITRTLECTETGMIDAVFVQFHMQLAPGIWLHNGITSDGHWGRTAYLLDSPRSAAPGDQLTVTAQHDAAHLTVSVHDNLN